MNEKEIKKRQLRWKCRRGMLELDILLQTFFDKCYDTLNSKDRKLFERVLAMDDTVLFACFMQGERAQDADLQEMVERISHVKT